MARSQAGRDDECLEATTVNRAGKRWPRRTAVVFDKGFVTMTLRTPCCQEQVERSRMFFSTGARNVRCEGCQDRYQVAFEGDLVKEPTAVWKPE